MPLTHALPLTTQGDLLYYGGAALQRLAAGTQGQVLQTNGNGAGANPQWIAAPAFTCQFASGGASGLNPVDATTYYWGSFFVFAPGTTDDVPGFWLPVACTLRAIYGRFTVIGTLGTNENSTLIVRKNATTDILTVTSTLQLTAGSNEFNLTGQNVALAAGDRIYLKWTTPTWVTNPTVVVANANLYFDVP